MIFIYSLLTSIIFGSNSKNKVMGQMQYVCSRCGRQAFHTIVRSRRWFTLYFLPVIPINKTTTSRCNLCGFQQAINNEQADVWFANNQQIPPGVSQNIPR
jgi:ribosomal protein L37E